MNTYNQAVTLISELEDFSVETEQRESISVIASLKALPRSGHSVRIDRFNLSLPKQSVYDHILTLAFNSDIYQKCLGTNYNTKTLANYCVFHDLAESIVGDVPRFTSRELANHHYLTAEEKKDVEAKANRLIADTFNAPLRADFIESIELLESDESKNLGIYKLFRMLDKTEPILSMWRYIFNYRTQIDIDKFLLAMADFFDNPEIVDFAYSENVVDFIEFLQSKDKAREYFKEGTQVLATVKQSIFKSEDLRKMIERPFHVVD